MVSEAVQKHNFRPVGRHAVGRRKAGSAANSLISSHFHTLSGENHCIKDVVLIDPEYKGGPHTLPQFTYIETQKRFDAEQV